ncbi:MAG: Gfo/Idh/MocA family oxidoreductase [Candidatus Aminicenantes bacterium]|nr:Gfo/Idh/MocA family oxidoreductase [Candidatus Aminicenantes bacterium]NIM84602.1 Gfo/Idh/MocA family oxidoreductase [Candidatus Aminicenantes bacterium]NIN24124.1 Gfo/Idh/MocA family oxidoreductase [Candidatus Aminicenantes bacterium]NIN47830.1 Gfo/Idh/MocA family oxidoreductase [Candidatus Aminicenantes bacterium]NIN90768.1 Gfo/Idh/MocA family oxidoreductase [Candidatus Aminicenantes bacterium]
MENEKNIALIGAGYWGQNHLKNLLELGVLHSVLDPNIENIRQRKEDFPHVNYVKDEGSILKNPEVKAVVIAAPAALHFELTREYLLAGKDVLVEKPLALTTGEGSQLVEIARSKNRILMVGHILQYHPAVIKLKELIDAGELGDICYIYSNRLNIGKLRAEENVLWSFAPHDISLILMLLNGQEPVHVDAHGGAYVKSDIYDTTLTILDFKNGIKSHIFVNWLHPFKEQKLVVVGKDKMAVFDDVNGEKLLIYPHKIDFIAGDIPVARKAQSYPIRFEMKEPLREELLHFIDCLENRETPKTDGEEGLKVLKVLERAEKQLRIRGDDGDIDA